MLSQMDIAALRMERQHLLAKAGKEEYDALFRDVSPVPMEGWCEPGSPPTLSAHAAFDDYAYNFRRRQRREILKGRFAGDALIGYVAREDLELYACLTGKELRPTFLQEKLLELLRREGPMSIGVMKEFTGLLVKEITPALHKLQAACAVYEDQPDNGGDRTWFLFEEEFPDIDRGRFRREEALALVIPRFARRHVFFDVKMIHSFYRSPLREIKAALARLTDSGALVFTDVEGVPGYLLAEDWVLLSARDFRQPFPSAMLIQRNDFLVKSNEHWLKERFKPWDKWEAMYYLLIDGEFRGAVIGRFKFGPHIVEDIVTDLGEEKTRRRRDEILSAVALRFPPKESPVRHYGGTPL